MAVTELGAIEMLAAGDADAGLVLSREAGWNQTLADWHVFLGDGITFGLRDADGQFIATAALLPSPPVTWISMVLVTPAWRRQGLAARLMTHCLHEAKQRGLVPWLDATPAGAAVYRQIGFFETGFAMQRWRRAAPPSAPLDGTPSAQDIEALLAADRRAMGFGRDAVLRRLAQRDGSAIYRDGDAVALVRDGDRVRHVGPLIASDASRALSLLSTVFEHERGALIIDVSAHETELFAQLAAQGFAFERPFARMVSGSSHHAPTPMLMAAAGPEFG